MKTLDQRLLFFPIFLASSTWLPFYSDFGGGLFTAVPATTFFGESGVY